MPSGLTVKVPSPKIAGFTADTVAALMTAVDAKVNTLNLQLMQPALNSTTNLPNTAGNVINGTISVSDIGQVLVGQTAQYIATVHWQEFRIPA